jgi:hypothetical protein
MAMPSARQGIDFLKARLDEELKPVDLPDFLGAAGFAIVLGPGDYVVVSVEEDSPDHLAITCGLVKDVENDRTTVLEYCNTETANNPGMPIYSHGSDVLLQTRSPMAVIARIPELLSVMIHDLPPYAADKRESWLRQGIRAESYKWDEVDCARLQRKATTPVM